MSIGARTNVNFWVVRGGQGGTSSAGAEIAYRIVGPGEKGEALIDSLVEAGSREVLRYAAEVACAVISRGKLVESNVPVTALARSGRPGWEPAAKDCVVELCRDRKVLFTATDQLLGNLPLRNRTVPCIVLFCQHSVMLVADAYHPLETTPRIPLYLPLPKHTGVIFALAALVAVCNPSLVQNHAFSSALFATNSNSFRFEFFST